MHTLLWIVGVYAALCLAAYYGNRLFMYFPDPTRQPPVEAGLEGVEEIELKTPDGETLVAWHSPARRGMPTVLYFHGNAGNAAGRAYKIDIIRADGSGVFYLNNRGYGGSSGKPSEEANVADAIFVYDQVRGLGLPPDRIVAFGESLGSGQAVRLAAAREVRAVVLEAPLTSTVAIGRRTWWFLPLGLLIADKFDNEENIGALKAPVLVMHGELDSVIPVSHGRRVYEAANQPKRLELFPVAGHADLFEQGAWDKARAFIARPRGR